MRTFAPRVRLLLSTAILGASSACARDAGLPAAQADPAALGRIRSVYVDEFGTSDASGLVRERIRLRLLRSDRFRLVETAAHADAILTGAATLDHRVVGGETDYTGNAIARLVERSSGRTVWSHEYRDRRIIAPRRDSDRGRVASRMADQIADELLKIAGPALS